MTKICHFRLLYNRAIVRRLTKLVEKYPDLRFNQLLNIANITSNKEGKVEDKFYEESELTWKHMLSSETQESE